MKASVPFALLGVLASVGPALSAGKLACEVLYRASCAPDQCEPIDSDPTQPIDVQIALSADHTQLTYTEAGMRQTARVHEDKLGKGYSLITGGPLDWPRYDDSKGGPGRKLGGVAIVLQPQGEDLYFSWRVKYLGTSEAQEYEDVLYGACFPR